MSKIFNIKRDIRGVKQGGEYEEGNALNVTYFDRDGDLYEIPDVTSTAPKAAKKKEAE